MQLSDSEKLTLHMLCEIHKALKIKDGLDAEFIGRAVSSGDTWAIKERYDGIFDVDETSQRVVDETFDILFMWDVIEEASEAFTAQERSSFRIPPHFSGFDGNNESTHRGAALQYVRNLERFPRFKSRDLNSHMPLLSAYRRMLDVFDKDKLRLSKDDVASLMEAMVLPENR